MYNLTLLSNSTGILGLTQTVNSQIMGGWLGPLILIAISGIIFMSSMYTSGDAHKAFGVTSFIAFALCIALSGLSLISPFAIFLTLIFAAIGVSTMWGSG